MFGALETLNTLALIIMEGLNTLGEVGGITKSLYNSVPQAVAFRVVLMDGNTVPQCLPVNVPMEFFKA